jgi:hypothetical protein
MSEETTAVQGEAPEIDAAPEQMDESGAHKALKAEREARKRLERELSAVKSQLSPEAARQMEERIKAAEDAARRAEEEASTKAKSLQSKYEKELQAKASELERERESGKQFKLRIEGERIFKGAEGLEGVANDGSSFFDYFWATHQKNFTFDDNGSLMVVDGQGDPILDDESGKRISPVEFVKRLHTDPVHGHLFKPAFGTGSGGRSVMGGRTVTGADIRSLPKSEKFRVAFGGTK